MTGTTDEKLIEPGSEVVMHFTLTLKDGTVADTSREGDPFRFTMGDGSLISGLELALYGLKEGDTQVLAIDAQNAFGFPDEANIHDMPRSEFPADMELEPGLIIEFSTPSGEAVPGAILEVGDETVKVDFNHPLAGHEITFDVEILSIDPDSPPA